jgi:hypothetical protein
LRSELQQARTTTDATAALQLELMQLRAEMQATQTAATKALPAAFTTALAQHETSMRKELASLAHQITLVDSKANRAAHAAVSALPETKRKTAKLPHLVADSDEAEAEQDYEGPLVVNLGLRSTKRRSRRERSDVDVAAASLPTKGTRRTIETFDVDVDVNPTKRKDAATPTKRKSRKESTDSDSSSDDSDSDSDSNTSDSSSDNIFDVTTWKIESRHSARDIVTEVAEKLIDLHGHTVGEAHFVKLHLKALREQLRGIYNAGMRKLGTKHFQDLRHTVRKIRTSALAADGLIDYTDVMATIDRKTAAESIDDEMLARAVKKASSPKKAGAAWQIVEVATQHSDQQETSKKHS